MTIGVIDLQVGNLFSVLKLLKRLNLEYSVVNDRKDVKDHQCLILPGVGSFPKAMEFMNDRNIRDEIINFSKTGGGILGICLGMQLFLDESEEFGRTFGLGLISGKVVKILEGPSQRVPNIGWRSVNFTGSKDHFGIENIVNRNDFYFAHSFYCQPDMRETVLGEIQVNDQKTPVIISNGRNIVGIQFHPELSDSKGQDLVSKILKQLMV